VKTVNLKDYIVGVLRPYVHAFRNSVHEKYRTLTDTVTGQEEMIEQIRQALTEYQARLQVSQNSVSLLGLQIDAKQASLASDAEIEAAQHADLESAAKAQATITLLNQILSEDSKNGND